MPNCNSIGSGVSEPKVAENRYLPLTCYTVTSHSYGGSQNSTFRKFVLPGPIVTKLGMVDYVGDPYSYANFSKFG